MKNIKYNNKYLLYFNYLLKFRVKPASNRRLLSRQESPLPIKLLTLKYYLLLITYYYYFFFYLKVYVFEYILYIYFNNNLPVPVAYAHTKILPALATGFDGPVTA